METKVKVTPESTVKVKNLGAISCIDDDLKKELLEIEIFKAGNKEQNIVISILEIINKINERIVDLDIVVIGSDEVLIEIKENKSNNNLFLYIRVTLVSLLLFFGAALAITNFHEDVNMKGSFIAIEYMITGKNVENPKMLQISYSLGLGVGMITFFNVLMKRKKITEPSPLEIEIHNYQKSIDEYILDQTKHNNNNK